MRILVAIANHGTNNQEFLYILLEEYRSMHFDVDLVVLSDQPKYLGEDVEVLVGAPTRNPWSLPFAHRSVFADRLQEYDVFIYSEDDTLVQERNISAFLEVNELLPDNQIPGFQRYELSESGVRTISSIHSNFRWEPASVSVCGGETFAAHTNLHSACYMLTQSQLRRAIASGGFLVDPHEDMFDMLVSAGIDPYIQCGFERRLCVSRIEEFLLHHLANKYVGKLGADQAEFEVQLDALQQIADGKLSRKQLVDPRSKLPTFVWDVQQYPRPDPILIELAPQEARHVLSIGATSGAAEIAAFRNAETITAIPIDAVIGRVASMRGLKVLAPELAEIERSVAANSIDTILLHFNLHHFPHPATLLKRLSRVAQPGASLLVGMPNKSYYQIRRLAQRSRHTAPVPHGGFSVDGVHPPGLGLLRRLERQRLVEWDSIRLTRTEFFAGRRFWLSRLFAGRLGREVYAVGRIVSSGAG
jgi:SAM-dependent methyltransferase